jgi:cellulose synthase/poly-beta-1,6-N-acetylglucosamine synthase-like glycosyltransferase
LLVLTGAALLGRTSSPPPGPDTRRFALLVPAHDEETLLGRLLANLHALDYPRHGFDVYVVADNCTGRTAAVARSSGAAAYERADEMLRGRGSPSAGSYSSSPWKIVTTTPT